MRFGPLEKASLMKAEMSSSGPRDSPSNEDAKILPMKTEMPSNEDRSAFRKRPRSSDT